MESSLPVGHLGGHKFGPLGSILSRQKPSWGEHQRWGPVSSPGPTPDISFLHLLHIGLGSLPEEISLWSCFWENAETFLKIPEYEKEGFPA